tara:strand:- start:68 stop:205 length:138 start_codon:yes stop_codon:yes gene_type:complete
VALAEIFSVGIYLSVFGFLKTQINSPASGLSILRMVLSNTLAGLA